MPGVLDSAAAYLYARHGPQPLGPPRTDYQRTQRQPAYCAHDHCDRPTHARNLCSMHYRRALRAEHRNTTTTTPV